MQVYGDDVFAMGVNVNLVNQDDHHLDSYRCWCSTMDIGMIISALMSASMSAYCMYIKHLNLI